MSGRGPTLAELLAANPAAKEMLDRDAGAPAFAPKLSCAWREDVARVFGPWGMWPASGTLRPEEVDCPGYPDPPDDDDVMAPLRRVTSGGAT